MNKNYLPVFCLISLLFLNCKNKENNLNNNYPAPLTESTSSSQSDGNSGTSEEETIEREKYTAYLTNFFSKASSEQSIDSLNVKVEAAMSLYANNNNYDDEKFVNINDKLVAFIESKNDQKVPESFYTAGLMESYGFFSIADGHAINHFKKGAKLGSINCVKYLAIIYFERILYKHEVTELCDPICMFQRGRNYIKENSLASLTKNDILSFTSASNNFLLKTIADHLNLKMSDDQILNYVTYLRTHANSLYELNNPEILNSLKAANSEVFNTILNDNPNIKISDAAVLFTFNYPAYENDDTFLHWTKTDLEKKGITTFDESVEKYDLDQLYGLTDFGSAKIYKGLLKYFVEKGDPNSEKLLKEYEK